MKTIIRFAAVLTAIFLIFSCVYGYETGMVTNTSETSVSGTGAVTATAQDTDKTGRQTTAAAEASITSTASPSTYTAQDIDKMSQQLLGINPVTNTAAGLESSAAASTVTGTAAQAAPAAADMGKQFLSSFIFDAMAGANFNMQNSGNASAGIAGGLSIFPVMPADSIFGRDFLMGLNIGYLNVSGQPNAVFAFKAEKLFGSAPFRPYLALEAGVADDLQQYTTNNYLVSFGPGIKYFFSDILGVVIEVKGIWMVENTNRVVNNYYGIIPSIGVTF